MLAGQVGIAGSTQIGNQVTLAGQVGVAGHLDDRRRRHRHRADRDPGSVERGAIVSGYPAIDNRAWLKASAVFPGCPSCRSGCASWSGGWRSSRSHRQRGRRLTLLVALVRAAARPAEVYPGRWRTFSPAASRSTLSLRNLPSRAGLSETYPITYCAASSSRIRS